MIVQRLPWHDICAIFDHLAPLPWAVLLDSQGASRWSIACVHPLATSTLTQGEWQHHGWSGVAGDAFAVMEAMNALGGEAPPVQDCEVPFLSGVMASLSYDCPSEKGLPTVRAGHWPQANLAYFNQGMAWDHQQQCCYVWAPEAESLTFWLTLSERTAATSGQPFVMTSAFAPQISAERYRQDIERIHEYIRAGDCYQVNYAQTFTAACQGSLWQRYRELRQLAQAPYGGFWQLPCGELLSLSPEQFLQLHDRHIATKPIKGTRARGQTHEHDQAEAESLLSSGKDRAENIMITDLLRNDLSKHAKLGSVKVPKLCALESFGQIHHLVTTITAELHPEASVVDLLRDAFPGGSITGAPKKRVMEIIDELEATARGPYCGSWLYWDQRGHLDSSIAIRVITRQQDQLQLWAGGGITLDSDWADEYQECLNKMGGVMQLLARDLADNC